VHGHTEALKKQGASDGKHYVLECDTCPRAKGTNYLKGQASWPWTHQHYDRSPTAAAVAGVSLTANQLTINSPTDDEAKPFLPILDSSTKTRVVPWLQTICGYQDDVFPAESVFPAHVMRLYCMLYENTRAVVFAFTGKLPVGYVDDITNKLVCPHKFNLSDRDADRNTFYQLMCVPCNDVDEFVNFADELEAEESMEKRLQAALKQITIFDPHKNVEREPAYQGVVLVNQPLRTFTIPDPAAVNPFRVRKTLPRDKTRPPPSITTYKEYKERYNKRMAYLQPPPPPPPPPKPQETSMVVNALAPPRNKYHATHTTTRQPPPKKQKKRQQAPAPAPAPTPDDNHLRDALVGKLHPFLGPLRGAEHSLAFIFPRTG